MAIVVPIVSEWNPKGVNKSLADIQQAEGKWGKAGAGMRKAFLPAVGVLGGLGAVGLGFAKKAEEAATATARLQQTLGNVKGVPQSAIDRQQALADSIEKTSAVDGEIIKGGQAILATFQKVGATAGETGGAFDRATQASVDLAAAGFGSVDGNAKQLGKALNDPIKGMAALNKAGVTFTQQQQDQIKAWEASGQSAKAQNAILDEVEKQVGGTAAATANDTDKMANAWENAQESLGSVLLPVLAEGSKLLEGFADWVERNKTLVVVLAGVVAGLAAAIVAINIAMKIWRAATVTFTAVQWLLNAALTANPIGIVVVLIAALVAGLVIAWKKSETFRNVVKGALSAVGKAFSKLWDGIKRVFSWLRDNWPLVLAILTGPVGIAVLLIVKNWDKIKDAAKAVVEFVKRWFGKFVDFFRELPARLARIGKGIFDFLGDAFRSVINFIIRTWNNLELKVPEVKIFGKTFGGFTIGTPDIPELRGSSSSGRTVVNNVTVNGAVDPQSTARQIRGLLGDYETTSGRSGPALVL